MLEEAAWAEAILGVARRVRIAMRLVLMLIAGL